MFQNLSLRAVSLILAFFVLCAAVLVAYGGTFVLKKAELLKSEWQTFEGVRSECSPSAPMGRIEVIA